MSNPPVWLLLEYNNEHPERNGCVTRGSLWIKFKNMADWEACEADHYESIEHLLPPDWDITDASSQLAADTVTETAPADSEVLDCSH